MSLFRIKPTVLVKMMVRSLIVLAVSILLVEYISYKSSSRQIVELTQERAQNLTALYAERFDRLFRNVEVDLLTISNLPSLRDYYLNRQYELFNEADQNLHSVAVFLSSLFRRNEAYVHIAIETLDGKSVLAVVDGDPRIIPTRSPIESHGLTDTMADVIQVQPEGLNPVPRTGAGALKFRIDLNVGGKIWGHAHIHYSLDALVADLKSVQLFDTGHLAIYQADGVVIYDPDIAVGESLKNRLHHPALAVLDIDRPATVQIENDRGDAFLVSASPTKRNQWVVAAVAREEEMLAKLNQTRDMIILLIVIAVALEFLAVSVFTRVLVVNPIRKLLAGISEVASGNHAYRVDVPTNDEFGQLGRSFNRMTVELQQRDHRIEQSEQRFRIIAETLPVGLAIATQEGGDILFVNQAWLDLHGYARDTLPGLKAPAVYWDPAERDSIIRHIQSGKMVRNREIVCKRGDGEAIAALLSAREIVYNDQKAILSIVVDYTERKQLEEQLRQSQKMDAIGQLTGGIAHDFNNLLAVIMGNAELMEERALETGAEPDPTIGAIIRSARRGAELTQRLLAFSRKQSLEPKIVHLDELVSGMADLLHRTLGETVSVHIVNAPGLKSCRIDPGQVENAILNLCINARDAMTDGGRIVIETANITVAADQADRLDGLAPGAYVLLTVTDTGKGIAPEHIDRVVEPFFTTKEVGKGTGLGLSMVYGFAKQSGGHLGIDSTLGAGTTISLYLPVAQSDAATMPADRDAPHKATQNRTVLLVEDDDDVRDLALSMLRSLGYTPLGVSTGAAAIEILHERPDIDILLTDIVLPGTMNGPAIASAAHRLRTDIKVLYMSGYPDTSPGAEGFDLAGVPLISKPFRKSELADRLNELTRH